MAARAKAWDCDSSRAGIVGSNPAGSMDVLSVVSVVCCQAEVPATGRSFVQRSPTECGVSEYDLQTSTMRRSWPTRAVEAWKKYIWNYEG